MSPGSVRLVRFSGGDDDVFGQEVGDLAARIDGVDAFFLHRQRVPDRLAGLRRLVLEQFGVDRHAFVDEGQTDFAGHGFLPDSRVACLHAGNVVSAIAARIGLPRHVSAYRGGIGHRGTYRPIGGTKLRGAKLCGTFVNYNLMKRPMSQAGASNTLCAPVYFVTPAVIPALAVM